MKGRAFTFAARMFVLAVGAVIACTDATGPGDNPQDVSSVFRFAASVDMGSRIVYLGAPKSEPINYIRAIVYDKTTNVVLGRIDQALDPQKNQFELSFKVGLPNPGFTSTRMTVELANHIGGLEVVQYAGRALDVKLQPSDRRQVDIDLYPGTLENLDVHGVKIVKPIPDRLERDSVRAAAIIDGNVEGARIVWSALDTAIATIDAATGVIRGQSPGTARVVAAVGVSADTAPVRILQRRDHIIVTPATATLPQLGQEVQFAGKVVDRRGAEMPGETVAWSITNPSIGSISSAGRFHAANSGTAQVWATAGSDTSLKASASVTVTYVPPALSRSTLTLSPDSIVANGSATSALTVQLRDTSGNEVTSGGKEVLAQLAGPGTLSALSDRGNGRYTAVLTAPTLIGTAKVAGSLGGSSIPNQAGITYIAGAPHHYQVTASAMSMAAEGSITLTAQLDDEFGNAVRVQGRSVLWSAIGGGIFSSASSLTNQDGIASITFTAGATAGSSYTLIATDAVLPAVKGDVGPVSTVPAAISLMGSTITATPSTVTANGISTSVITVTLKDALGNATKSSGGKITLVNAGTGTVSAVSDLGNGTYTAILTSPVLAGSAVLIAALDGNALTNTTTVAFVPGPAVRYLVTPSSTSVLVGGTVTVAAKLVDANGNSTRESGHVVRWSKTGAGGSFSVPTSITDSAGEAAVALTAGMVSGTVYVVSATDTASPGISGNSAAITSSPGGVLAGSSTLSASPVSIVANGSSTSSLVIQLKDAGGNNQTSSAGTVTLSNSGAGTLSAVKDNGDGTYGASLTSPLIAGSAVITGLLGTTALANSVTVSFVAGAASRFLITPSSTTPTAGTAITVTVKIVDANGNAVKESGHVVTWTSTGTGGSFATPTSATNAEGEASVTFTTSSTAGTTQTITGTDAATSSLSGTSAPITTGPGGLSLANSTVSANPTSITANGTSTSTITVQLKDAAGNNLAGSGGTVMLSKTGGGTLSAVTDNNNGTYSAVLTSSTISEVAVVTAAVGGSSITNTASVTYSAGSASLSLSTVTASPTSLTANGTSSATITIQLKDAAGTNFSTSGGTVTLVAAGVGSVGVVTDNNNGTYMAGITSTVSGTANITAKLNGSALTHSSNPATVTFTPGTASLATSTVVANPTSVTAGSTSQITVQLKDAQGNNLAASGGAVSLTTDLGSLSAVTDQNDGTYTATLTTSANGTATISAKLAGSALTNSATVTVSAGAASAATSTLSLNAANLQSGQTATITVVVKDASGNVLTNASSGDFALTTNIGSIGSVTCSSGTCTATYTASTVGTATISAKIGTTHVVNSPASLDVSAGDLHHFAVTATDGTALTADRGAGTAFNVKITAQDAGNNTVTSFTGTVDLTTNSLFGSGVSTTSAAFTSGVLASQSVTLVRAGTLRTITAKVTGGTATGTSAQFTVTAGAYTKLIALVPGESLAPGTTSGKTGTVTGQSAGTAFNVTVDAVDANWNIVSTVTNTVHVTATDAQATLPANASLSAGTGTFSVNLKTVGSYTMTASDVTDGAITASTSSAVTVSAGALHHFDLTLADGGTLSTAALTANTQFDIKLVAKDASDNTVTGFTGTVSISAAGATFASGAGTTASFVSGVLASHSIVISAGGTFDLTATGSSITATSSITVADNLASSATSTLGVGSNALTSAQTTVVTVTLKKADGSDYTTGAAGNFNLTASLGSLGSVSCTLGVCTSTYTASTAGNAVIAAKIGGTNIVNSTQTIVVSPGAASAATSTLAVGANSLLQNATTTITVVLKDAAGNTVTSGASGDFALAASIGSIGAVSCTSGTCTATYTATTLGTASISAKIPDAAGTGIVNSAQSVVVAAVPGAPTSLSGTPGNAQVSLSWAAPVSDGGSAVTDYLVQYKLRASGSYTTFSHSASTSTSIAVTGLTNGSLYDFQVSAVNVIGTGTAASTSSTPRTVPDAPTNLAGTPGTTSVALSWSAPANNGGSAITDYKVEYSATGANSWTTVVHSASTATALTVTGLSSGTTYDFRVSATNAAGTGATASLFTATAGSPSGPQNLAVSLNQITSNSHTATLTWAAPAFTGSGITDYIIEYKTASASSYTTFPHTASTATTATITGLVNSTTYSFRIAAKTSTLTGVYSSVVSATTTGPSERLSCFTPGSSNSSASTISITPCSGLHAGELIIIPVGVGTNNDGSAKAVTAEAGFTALNSTNNGTYNTTIFYKYATSADVGRSTPYVFSWTGNVKSIVTLVVYKNVTGTPTYLATTGTSATLTSGSAADPGVTAYTLLYVFTANTSLGSTTPNLGQWTVTSDLYKNTVAGANNANAVAVVTADVDKTVSGSTAAKTATTNSPVMSASTPWTAIVLTIKP